MFISDEIVDSVGYHAIATWRMVTVQDDVVVTNNVRGCVEKGGLLLLSYRDPEREKNASHVDRMWFVIDAYLKHQRKNRDDDENELLMFDPQSASARKGSKTETRKKEAVTQSFLESMDKLSHVWRCMRYLGCSYPEHIVQQLREIQDE